MSLIVVELTYYFFMCVCNEVVLLFWLCISSCNKFWYKINEAFLTVLGGGDVCRFELFPDFVAFFSVGFMFFLEEINRNHGYLISVCFE